LTLEIVEGVGNLLVEVPLLQKMLTSTFFAEHGLL
jgi:hypothetical protein